MGKHTDSSWRYAHYTLGAGKRYGQTVGGGRGLSRGVEGTYTGSGFARLGDDGGESGRCTPNTWGRRERDGASRGGGRGLPRGVGGNDARTRAARLGEDRI